MLASNIRKVRSANCKLSFDLGCIEVGSGVRSVGVVVWKQSPCNGWTDTDSTVVGVVIVWQRKPINRKLAAVSSTENSPFFRTIVQSIQLPLSHQSIHSFIPPSVRPFTPSIHPYIRSFIDPHPSVHPFVRPSVTWSNQLCYSKTNFYWQQLFSSFKWEHILMISSIYILIIEQ